VKSVDIPNTVFSCGCGMIMKDISFYFCKKIMGVSLHNFKSLCPFLCVAHCDPSLIPFDILEFKYDSSKTRFMGGDKEIVSKCCPSFQSLNPFTFKF
jgi:hypothetical protein